MSEEVSARVHFHLEPCLLEPRRREPVRLVLRGRRVRPIRARPTADRVQLVEPLVHPHAPKLQVVTSAESRGSEREIGASDNLSLGSRPSPTGRPAARAPGVRRAGTRRRAGRRPPTTCPRPKQRTRAVRRRRARRGPSAGSRSRRHSARLPPARPRLRRQSPFQPIDSPPAIASTGDQQPQRTAGERGRCGQAHRNDDPDPSQGLEPGPDDVGPATEADPRADRERLSATDHERRVPLGQPVLVVQEDDAESDHRDLRIHVDPAPEAEPPESAVAQRARDRGRLDPVLDLAASKHDDTDDGAQSTQRREEQKGRGRPTGRASRAGTDRAATSPPRGTAVCRTPSASPRSSGPNQCMTARPLAELTLAPAPPARASRTTSERKSGAYAAPTMNAAQPASPTAEDGALAVAVGGDPPRQHGQRRADPLRREEHADLGEGQVVLLAQRGHQDRQPDRERREAGLRERPRAEDCPPVRIRRYSPKGLIGRAPVETITLFVSR